MYLDDFLILGIFRNYFYFHIQDSKSIGKFLQAYRLIEVMSSIWV